MATLAIAPGLTFFVNGLIVEETRVLWLDVLAWVVAGACAIVGAWTVKKFSRE
jgi:hypothetical protein